MTPRLTTVQVSRPRRRPIRMGVPVSLVCSPVVALAGAVACLAYRISVTLALGAVWRFVSALPGSRFDIERDPAAVLARI